MPVVMYRNHQPGPTVLASDIKGTESVEWQGYGDPNGEDIQPVSEVIQATPAFSRAVKRGILSEVAEDSQEYLESQDAQQAHWDARTGQADRAAVEVIDQQANNDIIAVPCVGPSSRNDGTNKCGVEVSVRDAKRNDSPPLCNLHAALASEYVAEEIVLNGKSVKTWTRVTMGARERAQS